MLTSKSLRAIESDFAENGNPKKSQPVGPLVLSVFNDRSGEIRCAGEILMLHEQASFHTFCTCIRRAGKRSQSPAEQSLMHGAANGCSRAAIGAIVQQ
jgi:hypothetical protein